jgi:hypothetical protein
MGEIIDFEKYKREKYTTTEEDKGYFCNLVLYSDEIEVLFNLIETWFSSITDRIEKFTFKALKRSLKGILDNFGYIPEFSIFTHIYEIDPLIKYFERSLADTKMGGKEKLISKRILKRLQDVRMYYSTEIEKSYALSDDLRYLAMLDDWDKEPKKGKVKK